jgi:hypothetical protein
MKPPGSFILQETGYLLPSNPKMKFIRKAMPLQLPTGFFWKKQAQIFGKENTPGISEKFLFWLLTMKKAEFASAGNWLQ